MNKTRIKYEDKLLDIIKNIGWNVANLISQYAQIYKDNDVYGYDNISAYECYEKTCNNIKYDNYKLFMINPIVRGCFIVVDKTIYFNNLNICNSLMLIKTRSKELIRISYECYCANTVKDYIKPDSKIEDSKIEDGMYNGIYNDIYCMNGLNTNLFGKTDREEDYSNGDDGDPIFDNIYMSGIEAYDNIYMSEIEAYSKNEIFNKTYISEYGLNTDNVDEKDEIYTLEQNIMKFNHCKLQSYYVNKYNCFIEAYNNAYHQNLKNNNNNMIVRNVIFMSY